MLNVCPAGSRLVGIAVLGLFVATGAGSRAVEAADGAALVLVQSIPLADVRGRIDHLAIDVDAGRLFVAALASDSVEVVDLRAARREARLTGLQEPQGLAYQRDARRLFVASGRDGAVTAFSGSQFKPTQRLDGLDDADNVRLDADGHLYVGYGRALAILDAAPRCVAGVRHRQRKAHCTSSDRRRCRRSVRRRGARACLRDLWRRHHRSHRTPQRRSLPAGRQRCDGARRAHRPVFAGAKRAVRRRARTVQHVGRDPRLSRSVAGARRGRLVR
jgi:hypothetical protein